MVFQKFVLKKEKQLNQLRIKKKLNLYSQTHTEKKKSHSKKDIIMHQIKNKSLVLFFLADKLQEDIMLYLVYMMH